MRRLKHLATGSMLITLLVVTVIAGFSLRLYNPNAADSPPANSLPLQSARTGPVIGGATIPYLGHAWIMDNAGVTDNRVVFVVHEIELRPEYLSLVFSVSPGPGLEYSGTLTPNQDTELVDSLEASYSRLVYQNWMLYENVTVGSMSFPRIPLSTEYVELHINSFVRSDELEVVGPWVITLMTNTVYHSGSTDQYVAEQVIINENIATHGLTTVRWNDNGFSETDAFLSVLPVSTDVTQIATPIPTSTVMPTMEPAATLIWAPNASNPFTLRIRHVGSPTVRYVHAALEPTTGAYWYDSVDVNE